MKIYLASSWKNEKRVCGVCDILRTRGFEVYNFIENGFRWHLIPNVDFLTTIQKIKHSISQEKYKNDLKALETCDICILILPSGNDSHLEMGYAKGLGKICIIYGELDLGLMNNLADYIISTPDIIQLLILLDALDKYRGFKK